MLFYRAVLGRRAQARRRVRALRWRARLRLRPGPGYASLFELVFRWGRLAALHHGGRARPGLGFWRRVFLSCATAYAVRLGRAQYGRRVYARMEDQILVLAPQRTGKSGLIADRMLDHPGPVLVTSHPHRPVPAHGGCPRRSAARSTCLTRKASAACRRRSAGTSWPRAATWSWPAAWPAGSPARYSTDGGNLGNLEWFEKKGDVALACLLWAAAVSAATPSPTSIDWVQLDGHEERAAGAGQPAGQRAPLLAVRQADARRQQDRRARSGTPSTCPSSWAIIPALAAAVTPPPGRGLRPGRVHRRERHALPDRRRRRGLPGSAAVPGVHLVGALRRRPDRQHWPRPGGSTRRCGSAWMRSPRSARSTCR